MDVITGTPEYNSSSKKPVKDTVILSVCFLSVFISFQALQNLQSSLNQQESLGVTSLACLYGSIFIVSFFTPAIIYNIGVKASLMMAWAGHCIYVVCNFYPHWVTLIPGSIMLGFISCPLWTSAMTYLAALARVVVEQDLEKKPKKVTTIHAAFSHLTGLFSAIFSASQLLGNLLSSTILFQSSYDQVEEGPQVECGVGYCPHAGEGQHLAAPEQYIVYIMLGVFLILDLAGMSITWFCVTNLEQPRYMGREVLRKLRSYWAPYSQPKMWLILPVNIARGLIFSLHIGLFTEAYVGCALGIRMVGYVMAVWGLCTMACSGLLGYAARFTGRRFLFAVGFLVDAAILLVLLWWSPHSGSGAVLFVLAVLMGLADAIMSVQTQALVAVMFPAIVDAAYSVGGTWGSLSVAGSFLMAKFLCPAQRIYIALGLLAVAVLCYVAVELVHWRSLRTFSRDDHGYVLVNKNEDQEEEEMEGEDGGSQETQVREEAV